MAIRRLGLSQNCGGAPIADQGLSSCLGCRDARPKGAAFEPAGLRLLLGACQPVPGLLRLSSCWVSSREALGDRKKGIAGADTRVPTASQAVVDGRRAIEQVAPPDTSSNNGVAPAPLSSCRRDHYLWTSTGVRVTHSWKLG